MWFSVKLFAYNGTKGKKKMFNCTEGRIEPFLCPCCQFCSFLTVQFMQHIREKHVGRQIKISPQRLYKCKYCSFKSNFILSWFKHRKCGCPLKEKAVKTTEKTPSKSKKTFKCSQCPFRSIFEPVLKAHTIQLHSRPDLEWLKCEQCYFEARTVAQFRTHFIQEHAHSQPFKKKEKPVPAGAFSQELNGTKWFCCEKCAYRTDKRKYITEHLKRVHMDKWHTCDHCKFKSRRLDGLRTHVNAVHTLACDVKWYRCDQCDYKSKFASTLNCHVVTKHAAQRFGCDQCEFTTNLKKYLRQHVFRQHIAKQAR